MPEFFTSFYAQRPQELYLWQLYALKTEGEEVEVRGRKTVELLNAITYVELPTDPCILIPDRRWNPWLAMSEGLWILAGRNDVEVLKPYNRNITNYSDDGVTLYGAYGHRIYKQIDYLVERLRKDPGDRRAVLQIWSAGEFIGSHEDYNHDVWLDGDLTTKSKDPPCNDMVMFKIRQGRLHMTVLNRSNDIHWGLYAVNLPTFQMLQQYIAARLGVGVGTQTHFSNSLHYYTDEKAAQAITDRMLAYLGQTTGHIFETYPTHELMFTPNEWLQKYSHAGFAQACHATLLDVPLGSGWWDVFPFLGFARDFLRMYREHHWDPNLFLERDKEKYADWIQAGEIFVREVWK